MTAIPRPLLAATALVAAISMACGGGEAGDETETPTATVTGTSTAGPGTGAGAPPTATGTAAPSTGSQQTYEVVEGDTLFDIAAQFGVTADELMEANDISDPTLLQIGQILVIPSTGPAGAAPSGTGTPQVSPTATPTG